jgi:hypothetical protein
VVEARLLANIIGWQNTRRLLLTGKTISGKEAEDMGLVSRSFASLKMQRSYVDTFRNSLAELPPKAIQAQKRLIHVWEENNLEFGIKAGIEAFAEAFKDGGVEPKKYIGETIARRNEVRLEKEALRSAILSPGEVLQENPKSQEHEEQSEGDATMVTPDTDHQTADTEVPLKKDE